MKRLLVLSILLLMMCMSAFGVNQKIDDFESIMDSNDVIIGWLIKTNGFYDQTRTSLNYEEPTIPISITYILSKKVDYRGTGELGSVTQIYTQLDYSIKTKEKIIAIKISAPISNEEYNIKISGNTSTPIITKTTSAPIRIASIASDSSALQQITALKQNVFTNKVIPKLATSIKPVTQETSKPKEAEKTTTPKDKKTEKEKASEKEKEKEKEKDKSKLVGIKMNTVGADLGFGFFKLANIDGHNVTITANYDTTSDDFIWKYGGRITFDFVTIDKSSGTNLMLSGTGSKTLFTEKTRRGKAGGDFSLVSVNDSSNLGAGFSMNIYYAEELSLGDNAASYGAMVNYNGIGSLNSMYFNLAGMYGFPVGDRLGVNFMAILSNNLFMKYDGSSVSVTSPNMLNIGTEAEIYISEGFGVNLGVNTTLLIKDYSGFQFTLGSRYMF